MAGWIEIAIVAFGAQLAVLPGEKVQFIIAGLSTRYRPLLVVSAAGLAFAGWTALEIALGEALKGAVAPVYLDVVSGTLFLVFGYLIYRSIPDAESAANPTETDGGAVAGSGDLDVELFGREVPQHFGGFVPIFVLMATGEFGDKTQLVTISLAVQYGAHPAIWAGEMLAILPVSLANAYFFSRFSSRFDRRKAHVAAAAVFLFFGLDTFLSVATGFSVWETVVGALADAFVALA